MGNAGANAASKSDIKTLQSTVDSLNAKVSKLETATVNDRAIKGIIRNIDYTKISQELNTDNIAEAILKDPRAITDAVVPRIAENQGTITSLSLKLADNPIVAKALADKLTETGSKYRDTLRGEKGLSGDLVNATGEILKTILKEKMYDTKATMWCADGEMCKLPVGVNGINIDKSSSIHFGVGHAKDGNSGKIGYGTFDGGESGTLNIVGSGKSGETRRVRVWDNLMTTRALGVGDIPKDWTGLNIKNRNGSWTQFDWKDDGKNYIRGDTQIEGNVVINGTTKGILKLDAGWHNGLKIGKWYIMNEDDNLLFVHDNGKRIYLNLNEGNATEWRGFSTWKH